MFEELLALGYQNVEYDAWLIDISAGGQIGSGFVAINPNSKIPALLDHSTPEPTRAFESGAILFYLSEKFNAFLPTSGSECNECLSWLFWQMGSAGFLGGGFGHFDAYAPEKYQYPINRYTTGVKRQLDVLDKTLATREFLAGENYTIADIATQPCYGMLVSGPFYNAQEFLDVQSYGNVLRWSATIQKRVAVQRGLEVPGSGTTRRGNSEIAIAPVTWINSLQWIAA